MTYVTIPMDDETYAHLPNLPKGRDHIKEIDLDPQIEHPLREFPEKLKESPLDFCPNDLPFTQEEYFDDILWPEREYYQQQLEAIY